MFTLLLLTKKIFLIKLQILNHVDEYNYVITISTFAVYFDWLDIYWSNYEQYPNHLIRNWFPSKSHQLHCHVLVGLHL